MKTKPLFLFSFILVFPPGTSPIPVKPEQKAPPRPAQHAAPSPHKKQRRPVKQKRVVATHPRSDTTSFKALLNPPTAMVLPPPVDSLKRLPDTSQVRVNPSFLQMENRFNKKMVSVTVTTLPEEPALLIHIQDMQKNRTLCEAQPRLSIFSKTISREPTPPAKIEIRGKMVPISPLHPYQLTFRGEVECSNNPELKVSVVVTDNGLLEGNPNEYAKPLLVQRRQISFNISPVNPFHFWKLRTETGKFDYYFQDPSIL